MFSAKLFVLGLLLVSGAVASELEDGIERADDSHLDRSTDPPTVVAYITDENGKHEFRAPPFDMEEEAVPIEVKNFNLELIEQVMGKAKEIVNLALVKQSLLLYPVLGKIAYQFFIMSRENNAKSNALKIKYGDKQDRRFLESSVGILPDFLKQAKEETKNVKLTKEEAKKYSDSKTRKRTGARMMLILDGIQELVKNSPVGVHLNFRKMTTDGVVFEEEGAEIIKYMQKSGLDRVLGVIKGKCEDIIEETRELDRKFEAERAKAEAEQKAKQEQESVQV